MEPQFFSFYVTRKAFRITFCDFHVMSGALQVCFPRQLESPRCQQVGPIAAGLFEIVPRAHERHQRTMNTSCDQQGLTLAPFRARLLQGEEALAAPALQQEQ